ncbi:glycosyltransferase family 87 protein [Roseiflexus sp.]|uniref:glycosyltransferase family 87 protein n=1 Tax=Roseiflexus sp. TaxID=2562120 RepID=UPI00258710E3|nr:glycosyltransferase family 87 protein [Roseiflexus sp.]
MKRNREVGGRLPYSEPLLHTLLRLLIGGGVLLCGLLLAQRLPNPDLFGDYVAACAWWQRLPKHLWLAGLSRCDADVDYNAFGPGAHPPFSTVFFLPLGFLAWTDARLAWLIISGACLIGVWHYYRVPVSVCAATALFGVFGLYRGTMEPFLFALMMVALSQEEERPLFSAALIGLAAAIKVYPVLMLAALVIARRLNALIAGIVTGGLATAAGDLVLGIGKTGAWMGHMTPNALAWRINFAGPHCRGLRSATLAVGGGSRSLWCGGGAAHQRTARTGADAHSRADHSACDAIGMEPLYCSYRSASVDAP